MPAEHDIDDRRVRHEDLRERVGGDEHQPGGDVDEEAAAGRRQRREALPRAAEIIRSGGQRVDERVGGVEPDRGCVASDLAVGPAAQLLEQRLGGEEPLEVLGVADARDPGAGRIDPQAAGEREVEALPVGLAVRAIRAPSGVLAVTQFMYVFSLSIRATARAWTMSAMPIPTALPSVSSVRSRTKIRWMDGPWPVGPE